MTASLLTLLDELAELERRATQHRPVTVHAIPGKTDEVRVQYGNIEDGPGYSFWTLEREEDARFNAALRNAHTRLDAEVRRLLDARKPEGE